MSRFEIVRTDDADQPWHARFVGHTGRILFTSENYTRMVGAERAVLSFANAGSSADWVLKWNVEGVEKVFIDDVTGRIPPRAPMVKYLDKRRAR